MALLSRYHQMIPPLRSGFVQSALRFRKKRIQNDDLPEPLGPLTRHENWCLNGRSSHMVGHAWTRSYHPRPQSYLYPHETGILLDIHRLLKNDIKYSLFSGSVTIANVPPAFLLRLIIRYLCTLTLGSPCSKIIALITSKLTNCEAW